MALMKNKGFWGRISEKIGDALLARTKVDEELFEELEEILVMSDIGLDTTMNITERLRDEVKKEKIIEPSEVRQKLKDIMIAIVDKGERQLIPEKYPVIILMIGINGGGKTTTIGKLANYYKNKGLDVLLAGADTFRAAASDQLKIWAERAGVNVITRSEGADPAAVLYDAIDVAKAKDIDILICDTAGRLQNKSNLMKELEKMSRIINERWQEAHKETILVLDATTGKNAISQAEQFGEIADLSGTVITKLDGTAKGGIAVTVVDEFDLPIKFIGSGEKIDDIEIFDPSEFIGGIFDE